jgi:hypothetical protein
MESLDGDCHFVEDVNSGVFDITESLIFNDLDLSKNPEVESGGFSINFSSGVNQND